MKKRQERLEWRWRCGGCGNGYRRGCFCVVSHASLVCRSLTCHHVCKHVCVHACSHHCRSYCMKSLCLFILSLRPSAVKTVWSHSLWIYLHSLYSWKVILTAFMSSILLLNILIWEMGIFRGESTAEGFGFEWTGLIKWFESRLKRWEMHQLLDALTTFCYVIWEMSTGFFIGLFVLFRRLLKLCVICLILLECAAGLGRHTLEEKFCI